MKVGIALARALALTLCAASALPAALPATGPAPSPVPEAEFIRLGKLLDVDLSRPDTDRQKAVLVQMDRFIVQSLALEARFPGAPNLYVLRLGILRATSIIFKEKKDIPSRQQMVAAAQAVLNLPAPPAAKVYPDRIVTAELIQPLGGAPAANPEPLIRAFVARYAQTPAAAQAMVEGYRLANHVPHTKLAAEFVTALEKKHADDPGVFRFLAETGRRPLFRAELTRLDRTRLLLPDDMKGKIVVVEFWATWEPACAGNQPLLRKIHSRYKSKGVEVVSVSLDPPGRLEDLKQYVRDAGLLWAQTYSGLREDVTVRRCSVESLPSLWVLDRQGRVVSVGTGTGLLRTVDSLLAEP